MFLRFGAQICYTQLQRGCDSAARLVSQLVYASADYAGSTVGAAVLLTLDRTVHALTLPMAMLLRLTNAVGAGPLLGRWLWWGANQLGHASMTCYGMECQKIELPDGKVSFIYHWKLPEPTAEKAGKVLFICPGTVGMPAMYPGIIMAAVNSREYHRVLVMHLVNHETHENAKIAKEPHEFDEISGQVFKNVFSTLGIGGHLDVTFLGHSLGARMSMIGATLWFRALEKSIGEKLGTLRWIGLCPAGGNSEIGERLVPLLTGNRRELIQAFLTPNFRWLRHILVLLVAPILHKENPIGAIFRQLKGKHFCLNKIVNADEINDERFFLRAVLAEHDRCIPAGSTAALEKKIKKSSGVTIEKIDCSHLLPIFLTPSEARRTLGLTSKPDSHWLEWVLWQLRDSLLATGPKDQQGER